MPLRVDKFHIMCKGCHNEVSDSSQEVTPMPTWQPVALRDGKGRTFESLPASLISALRDDVEAIPTEGQPLPWLHSGCKGRSFEKVTQYGVSPDVMVACFGTRQQFDPVARKVGFPLMQGLSCLVAAWVGCVSSAGYQVNPWASLGADRLLSPAAGVGDEPHGGSGLVGGRHQQCGSA